MKIRLYILFILLLTPYIKVLAQPMPPACTDSRVRYAASHSIDQSIFNWIVKNGAADKTIYGDGDSIDIHWGSNPGIYRIGVSEISNYNFEGAGRCYGDTIWTTVEVRGTPINIGADQEWCYGQPYEFDAGDGFSTYKWNNNDTLNTRYLSGIATKTDTIVVTVENSIKCRNADTAILLVRPIPIVKITDNGTTSFRDTMLCGTEKMTLDAGNQHSFFSWSSGELSQTIIIGALEDPAHKETAKMYKVTAANEYGCESSDSVFILRCLPPSNDSIPTVFTPNGDSWNQTWRIPKLQYYPDATVDVYDRWGRLVFHSDHGYQKEWNGTSGGKNLPMDNYFYIIRIDKNSKPFTGNVMILR